MNENLTLAIQVIVTTLVILWYKYPIKGERKSKPSQLNIHIAYVSTLSCESLGIISITLPHFISNYASISET
jgi:hypothetical protein